MITKHVSLAPPVEQVPIDHIEIGVRRRETLPRRGASKNSAARLRFRA
jgi:hypothetical protein